MSVFLNPEFDNHEKVLFCHDTSVGLHAIIAIHNTNLGPAAGGCRMFPYDTFNDALTDVLRLSKGMSYKNAIAGLPLGGGKCVIIADPNEPNKSKLLQAFSKHVQDLHGKYWTAIDVGVGPKDADILAEHCDYVFARSSEYPEGFNPSQFTALGGFYGIRATVKHIFGKDDLQDITVAIQGLGATGRELSRLLFQAGAKLMVSDINQAALKFVVDQYDAVAIDSGKIYSVEADIFAPCAMGAIINDQTISKFRFKAICGLANNQLASPKHGEILADNGIIYVPDFLVNSGGMIGAGSRIFSNPTVEESKQSVLKLYDIIFNVLEKSANDQQPTALVVDKMAQEIIFKNI
ncbi:leucine dehydrogenase [Aquimarina sp. D1M17]|uniref:Leu/Phe/Val dehydrogenase n=1 Tax=Aquimarina acroporae TaxID=2937283 RepID=UPI0020BDAC2B|nr:Glu/Leu/Phe/Val dehydrogenase dimerization domain-containing protein [Aquimarina acroporae]MCK8520102.1 leucine dehydrogenase [Aquimarina acroporae]